ncbi:MAG: MASE1 domain-containing protein, partial [Rhizobacter sp.]
MPALRTAASWSPVSLAAAGRTWTARVLAVALACYLAGRLSLSIPPLADHVSLVWLPTGIALAALLRWGLAMWPGIALAAFLLVEPTLPVGLAAALAGGFTLGPVAAAWSLRRLGLHHALDRRQDLWHFCLVGGLAGTLLSATNGVLWLSVGGHLPGAKAPVAWFYW